MSKNEIIELKMQTWARGTGQSRVPLVPVRMIFSFNEFCDRFEADFPFTVGMEICGQLSRLTGAANILVEKGYVKEIAMFQRIALEFYVVFIELYFDGDPEKISVREKSYLNFSKISDHKLFNTFELTKPGNPNVRAEMYDDLVAAKNEIEVALEEFRRDYSIVRESFQAKSKENSRKVSAEISQTDSRKIQESDGNEKAKEVDIKKLSSWNGYNLNDRTAWVRKQANGFLAPMVDLALLDTFYKLTPFLNSSAHGSASLLRRPAVATSGRAQERAIKDVEVIGQLALLCWIGVGLLSRKEQETEAFLRQIFLKIISTR